MRCDIASSQVSFLQQMLFDYPLFLLKFCKMDEPVSHHQNRSQQVCMQQCRID